MGHAKPICVGDRIVSITLHLSTENVFSANIHKFLKGGKNSLCSGSGGGGQSLRGRRRGGRVCNPRQRGKCVSLIVHDRVCRTCTCTYNHTRAHTIMHVTINVSDFHGVNAEFLAPC